MFWVQTGLLGQLNANLGFWQCRHISTGQNLTLHWERWIFRFGIFLSNTRCLFCPVYNGLCLTFKQVTHWIMKLYLHKMYINIDTVYFLNFVFQSMVYIEVRTGESYMTRFMCQCRLRDPNCWSVYNDCFDFQHVIQLVQCMRGNVLSSRHPTSAKIRKWLVIILIGHHQGTWHTNPLPTHRFIATMSFEYGEKLETKIATINQCIISYDTVMRV